jgi:hypothetical protein
MANDTHEIKVRLLDSHLFSEVIEKIDAVINAGWDVVENPVASRVDKLEEALEAFRDWRQVNG